MSCFLHPGDSGCDIIAFSLQMCSSFLESVQTHVLTSFPLCPSSLDLETPPEGAALAMIVLEYLISSSTSCAETGYGFPGSPSRALLLTGCASQQPGPSPVAIGEGRGALLRLRLSVFHHSEADCMYKQLYRLRGRSLPAMERKRMQLMCCKLGFKSQITADN